MSFSPTDSVRKTCHEWLRRGESLVSINLPALDRFSNEIARSIHSNQSLQVAEWDADGKLKRNHFHFVSSYSS
jgi:hypothetical protein